MPPKRKKRSKSMPKQSQSQRQSVVVNVGTSKTKSKPRKSRGRGGLPPPSYQHNLAPTFVTQQATDYNPVIGAIASLTSRLQQEPRIQQPATPLSSTTSFSTQQAQAMAGVKAEERRAGPTADSFVSHASQVRNATEDYVMPRETIGTNRPPTRIVTGEPVRQADEYFTERLLKPTDNFQRLPSHKRAEQRAQSSLKVSSDSSPIVLPGSSSSGLLSSDSSPIISSDSEGPAAGGGGPPRVFKTPPKVLAGGGGFPRELISPPEELGRTRQQTRAKIKRDTEKVEFI